MPCYHPNKVFDIGVTSRGATKYKFTGYQARYVYPFGDDQWLAGNDVHAPLGARFDFKVVRCGQCIDCRLARARVMAERGLLELESHESSMFLTLTYSPEYVPLSYSEGSGPFDFVMTLFPDDFTKFMKRLRKAYSPARLRFMACGEYGDETFRPHYHVIVFGLNVTDVVFFSKTDLGDILYTSDTISKIWGYGHVSLGEVTYESIGYVSRYILKKQTGKNKDYYEKLGILPPFARYSNRPGIGGLYLDAHLENFLTSGVLPDILYISTKEGGKRVSFPRYFLDKVGDVFESEVDRIKESRLRNAVARVEAIERELQIPYSNYLLLLERAHQDRSKGLIRNKL